MKRRKVYLTDRDDDGKLFGRLVAVDDEFIYDVQIAPHLVVLSNDGRTRIPNPQPATEGLSHTNDNTGEPCDCNLSVDGSCYVDPNWEPTTSGSDPSNGTS